MGRPSVSLTCYQPRPRWLGQPDPQCAIRVPLQYAVLASQGSWDMLVLPHAPRTIRYGSSGSNVNWRLLGIRPSDLPQPALRYGDPFNVADLQVDFDSRRDITVCFQQLLGQLDVQAHEGRRRYREVERCLLTVRRLHRELDDVALVKTIKEIHGRAASGEERPFRNSACKVSFLLKAMMMAVMLKKSGDFADILLRSCQIVAPPALMNAVSKLLHEARAALPHKSTISRWRFILDGAYMLNRRAQTDRGGGQLRYLMSDSSLQHGRDFSRNVVLEIAQDNIVGAFDVANDLINLRLPPATSGDDDSVELELQYFEALQRSLEIHHLPIMCLGSGRTTLLDKFTAVMCCVLHESGSCAVSFVQYVSNVRVIATDFGVEFGLPTVAPIAVQDLFPWYRGLPAENVVNPAEATGDIVDLRLANVRDQSLEKDVSLQDGP
ncbi:unnamed protein product [Prorocentrum cordatum]|uniref:Anaphase-promoting complex subunit 1 n=1 Tax=Prorocentrum cordatum TaxID=2364126 RepID=A0ABN9X462_9DINO|nr:unnamed protein product [Polarella glacialis]